MWKAKLNFLGKNIGEYFLVSWGMARFLKEGIKAQIINRNADVFAYIQIFKLHIKNDRDNVAR